jgi:hypothetical protein
MKSKKVKCTLVQALRLCRGRTAQRGSRGTAPLFLDHGTRRGWGVSVTPRPLFTPGKTRYPLYRRLGRSQDCYGLVRKISPQTGFDPRTVQSVVACRYTDYAIRSTHQHEDFLNILYFATNILDSQWHRMSRSFRRQYSTCTHNNKINQIPLYFDKLAIFSFLPLYKYQTAQTVGNGCQKISFRLSNSHGQPTDLLTAVFANSSAGHLYVTVTCKCAEFMFTTAITSVVQIFLLHKHLIT